MQEPDKQQDAFNVPKFRLCGGGFLLGSLCTGYGGLDMAVQRVFDARLTWVADNDRHAARLLSARFPGVPNLGDLGAVDWATVDPVDVLCAGFPCQDISFAGRGAGIAHCVGDA